MNIIAGAVTKALAVALIISGFLFACDRTEQKPAVPPKKITIALTTPYEGALAQVAQSLGYFRAEELEVTARLHPYGKLALEDMLAGKADFSTVAETPIMFAIMRGEKIAVIATIQTSDTENAIVARKDKGILALGDLKGKKIAVTRGTTLDFFLDTILAVNGISREDVEVVNLKAEEMADALAQGDIDAISTFSVYTIMTQRKLGDLAITFKDKDIYRESFNVVAMQGFIRNNPETVKKMLRALVKAEQFIQENPAEAQKIASDFSGTEISIIHEVWADSSFAARLDQALLLSLEDESQWAINNGLTEAREIPNYLDYIYLDGLKSVKPDAVSILK
ncbi:MAG: hypothetical protein ACD_75C01522G0003 [uncultured bacterium]|nr:MAG: hypothetical protein ACD_75C01522G0003 [uncultured bacterium]HBG20073.1 nitrate ABC transporter substrate-binding protein [Desulfobulbaceae bacterium]